MSDIQRHRNTERPSNRDTERPSHRDADDTDGTEDVPRLAASVSTLQEAVQLSLQPAIDDNSLFTFARALKAFEITTGRRLNPADLDKAFSLWWGTAKQQLPEDADFDEYRLDFLDKFGVAKTALGSNSLEAAIRLVDAGQIPPQAERFNSSKIKRLVAICYHLQVLQGTSPFFLSTRDAAKITGTNDHWKAARWLSGLVRDRVLIEVKKGTRVRATRFRFNAPEFMPGEHVDSSCLADAKAGVSPIRGKKPSTVEAKSSGTPAAKEPTAYELTEKKKAIRELLAGIGSPAEMNSWNPDQRAAYRRLNASLKVCNEKLANLGEA